MFKYGFFTSSQVRQIIGKTEYCSGWVILDCHVFVRPVGTREDRFRLFLTLKSAVEISLFLQQPSLQAGASQDHHLSLYPSNETELLGGKFNSSYHTQYRKYWI